jgi:hypothetical protein
MSKEFLRDQRHRILDAWMYSVQRIDLLIISISGGGIYVCLKTLEYIGLHNGNNACIIKIAGLFFVVGIVLNFVSQFLSLKMHEWDSYSNYLQLEENEEKEKEIDLYDKKVNKMNIIVVFLNYFSSGIMLAGLILIAYYFLTF